MESVANTVMGSAGAAGERHNIGGDVYATPRTPQGAPQ